MTNEETITINACESCGSLFGMASRCPVCSTSDSNRIKTYQVPVVE
jgi:rubrerythrin